VANKQTSKTTDQSALSLTSAEHVEGQAKSPAYLNALEWRLAGPHRGGRVVAVAGDPHNRQVFYFGSICPVTNLIVRVHDGGHTWTGGTIVHHHNNEGFVGGAVLDQRGNCYLADNVTGSKADGTPTTDATIWQLRSEQSDGEPAYRMPGQSARLVGVSPSGGGQPAELVATIETPQPPTFCIGDVCPSYTPHPPQLLATTLP